MDTRRLAAFKAAYEMGSMAKAAEALFISPQGLSKSISQLEAELGGALFERTNRGVEPTAFARSVYPKAVKIVELASSMEGGQGTGAGVLSVATVGGGIAYLGRGFVEEFERQHPGLSLRVREGNDAQVRELVSSGEAACGFTAGPVDHEPFSTSLFARHPHCLVVRADDPLAARPYADLSMLTGRRVALMGPGNAPFAYIPQRMAREGVEPAEVVGVVEMATALFMVAEEGSDTVAVTVDFAIPPGSRRDLVALPFSDTDFTWDEHFITSARCTPDARCEALRRHARDWFCRNEARAFPWRSPEGPWRLYAGR